MWHHTILVWRLCQHQSQILRLLALTFLLFLLMITSPALLRLGAPLAPKRP